MKICFQTCFFHTGGFFAPIDGGLYNGFRIVFRNPNETVTMDSLLKNIHDHRPSAIVCGSHHAMQLAGITKNSKYDLTSVKIFIPLGAAVRPDLVEQLQKLFPSMLPVSLVTIYNYFMAFITSDVRIRIQKFICRVNLIRNWKYISHIQTFVYRE